MLLTHLHLDHIQGLGFFAPLFAAETALHLWGPASATSGLRKRLSRYLSPPLFPVHLRDLPNVEIHDVIEDAFEAGSFRIQSSYVCHPGLTLGFRIEHGDATLAYIPDHEPALGAHEFPLDPLWTSGYALARGADTLIHDAQYTATEYVEHVGWGHSSIEQAVAFSEFTQVGTLVTFHHDPWREDEALNASVVRIREEPHPHLQVVYGRDGDELEVKSGEHGPAT